MMSAGNVRRLQATMRYLLAVAIVAALALAAALAGRRPGLAVSVRLLQLVA